MHEYRLNPPSPFSFEQTAALLSPGSDDSIDVFDGKRYTRLLDLDGRMRLALVSSLGVEQRPELIITLMNGTEQDERQISRVLSRMMGMDQNLTPFYERCRADPHLYGLSRDHYGLKTPLRPNPFEALALTIVSQPGSIHFFRASLSSLAESISYSVAYAGHTFCAFPDAENLAARKPKDLIEGTITAQQAEQLLSLARCVTSGDLDLKGLSRRPLDTLLSELQSCKGIGPLGAQLTALMGYGRLDCFPSADSVLRRWLGRNVFETEEIDEQQTRDWAEPWGDLRGYVAIYIYADLLKEGLI